MKPYWRGKLKKGERNIGNDTSGKITSRGKRTVVYQCTTMANNRECWSSIAANLLPSRNCEDGT